MNLLELTHPERVFINPPCRSPDALIRLLAEPLVGQNVITDKEAFIQSVLHRESEGPTALGEELAVPHGKSDAVRQVAFCLALFDEPILWPGLEGDEPVRMVFLLAIPPAEAGSTHMQLLTTLTSSLMDTRMRDHLLAARTCDEAMLALRQGASPKKEAEPERSLVVPAVLGTVAALAFLQAGLSWACAMS